MSGRQTRIGYLLASRPKKAHAELQKLFNTHVSLAEVARAEGVDRMTVRRWLALVTRQGGDIQRAEISPRKPVSRLA